MHGSKLLELIRVLTGSELEALERFLQSPYFQKGRQAALIEGLFLYIKKEAPHFNTPALEKEQVYAYLFPGEPKVKGKLEKLMSQLVQQIRQFILVEFQLSEQNPIRQELIWARFNYERGLHQRFEQIIEKGRDYFHKHPPATMEAYHQRFLIEEEWVQYLSEHNPRSGNLQVPELLTYLDQYYLLTKLQYSVLLLSQKIHTSIQPKEELALMPYLEAQLQTPTYRSVPILQIYYQAYQLLRIHPGDFREEFEQLRVLVRKHQDILPADQQKTLQTLLRMQAISAYNRGEQHYLKAAFELYQEHLEKGYLYYENGLLPSTFRNIVTVGLRSKAYDWIEQFLEAHRSRLVGTAHPEEVFSLNQAYLFFHRQEYSRALDCLADKYQDLYYHLAARRLEVMIYYELKSPLLEPKMEAFKVYIYRLSQKKLPEKPKMGNNHFLDLLRQIIHPKTLNNPERIQKLRNKLSDYKVIAEREWLQSILTD